MMGKITDYLDSIEGSEQYRELPFWKRWGEKELREKLDDLGATAFARGYQMDALSEGDFTFQNFYKVLKYDVGLEIYEEPDLIYVMGVDISSSRRPGSVLFTTAVTPQGYRYPIECKVGKWSSPKLVSEIQASYNQFHHQTILVENNSVQTMLVEWLEHEALYLPVEGYLTGAQKWNPENGLPGLDVEFQKGLWLFPMVQVEGHDTLKHDCGWCTWIREMANHPGWNTTDTVMACFVPETRVMTERGNIPISDIKIGDKVLTHKGNWERVAKIHIRNYDGEILHIKPYGNRGIRVTPEHPFYASKAKFNHEDRSNRLIPSGFDWILAKDVRHGRKDKGDFLFMPTPRFPIKHWEIDLSKYLLRPKKHGSKWRKNKDYLYYRDDIRVKRFIGLNYAFGRVIGLYLAEGNIVDGHQISYAFHKREINLCDELDLFFDSLGIREGQRKIISANGMRYTISCSPLARFFMQFGKRDKKNLSADLLYTPLEFQKGVISGWFDGDGHLSRAGQHGVSISKGLIDTMRIILWRLGLAPTIANFKQSNPNSKETEKLSLNLQETAKYHDAKSRLTNSYFRPFGNGLTSRIREIKKEYYKGKVYNLHVENDNSYCAEFVAVHNCWFAKEAIRLYWNAGFYEETPPDEEGVFFGGSGYEEF